MINWLASITGPKSLTPLELQNQLESGGWFYLGFEGSNKIFGLETKISYRLAL